MCYKKNFLEHLFWHKQRQKSKKKKNQKNKLLFQIGETVSS